GCQNAVGASSSQQVGQKAVARLSGGGGQTGEGVGIQNQRNAADLGNQPADQSLLAGGGAQAGADGQGVQGGSLLQNRSGARLVQPVRRAAGYQHADRLG